MVQTLVGAGADVNIAISVSNSDVRLYYHINKVMRFFLLNINEMLIHKYHHLLKNIPMSHLPHITACMRKSSYMGHALMKVTKQLGTQIYQ